MNHSVIEDNNIIVRYVQGKLDGDQAARFEEHYFECSSCLESLELSRRLDDGVKGAVAEDGRRWTRALVSGWLMRGVRHFQWPLALALLAVIVLPWLILTPRISRLSSALHQATAPEAGALTWGLSSERSAGVDEAPSAEIVFGGAPAWVTLALELPPFADASTYRVRVLNEDGSSLWRSGLLESDAPGKIHLRLHSTWLEAADYQIELEAFPSDAATADEKGELAATYSFRVRVES